MGDVTVQTVSKYGYRHFGFISPFIVTAQLVTSLPPEHSYSTVHDTIRLKLLSQRVKCISLLLFHFYKINNESILVIIFA